MRQFLVEVIKPKRDKAIVARRRVVLVEPTSASYLGRNRYCCSLYILVWFDSGSPVGRFRNSLEDCEKQTTTATLPCISAPRDSQYSAPSASWQTDDAPCPWSCAVVDTRHNLCQIQSYICDAVQPMLLEGNHCKGSRFKLTIRLDEKCTHLKLILLDTVFDKFSRKPSSSLTAVS